MTQAEALQEYLLRLADSDMILGQRLCELCGKAPALEEELALMNVALDLVGQARNWYEYAAELMVTMPTNWRSAAMPIITVICC
jgi:ring-1,2-phenylacetyl-CoA epoxidase subunit PaaC